MEETRHLNVNQLNTILAKHFGADSSYTEKVIAGSPGHTHNIKVGAGNICNIAITLSFPGNIDEQEAKTENEPATSNNKKG